MGANKQTKTGRTRPLKRKSPNQKTKIADRIEFEIFLKERNYGCDAGVLIRSRPSGVARSSSDVGEYNKCIHLPKDHKESYQSAAELALEVSPTRFWRAVDNDPTLQTKISEEIRSAMKELSMKKRAKQILADERAREEAAKEAAEEGEPDYVFQTNRALATRQRILDTTKLLGTAGKESTVQLAYFFLALLRRAQCAALCAQHLYLQGCAVAEDEQVFSLMLRVLQIRGVWLVNLGEIKLSDDRLRRLIRALGTSNVTHMYYFEGYCPEWKKAINPVLRRNREKPTLQRRFNLSDTNHEQNWVICQDDKSWFAPKRHPANKQWAIRHGLTTQGMFKTVGKRVTKKLLPEWEEQYKGRHELLPMDRYLTMINQMAGGAWGKPEKGTWKKLGPIPVRWRDELAKRALANKKPRRSTKRPQCSKRARRR